MHQFGDGTLIRTRLRLFDDVVYLYVIDDQDNVKALCDLGPLSAKTYTLVGIEHHPQVEQWIRERADDAERARFYGTEDRTEQIQRF